MKVWIAQATSTDCGDSSLFVASTRGLALRELTKWWEGQNYDNDDSPPPISNYYHTEIWDYEVVEQ